MISIYQNGQNNDLKCEKCKKNEAKYKIKPTHCIYCQLPAAFVDNKCVWCSYGERKTGPPVPCVKCKIKSAFPKDRTSSDATWICRLCSLLNKTNKSLGKRKSSDLGRISQYKRNNEKSDHKNKQHKVTFSTDLNSEQVQSEHILVVQQYKDEISSLRKQCSEKDRLILERDKKIAALNAEILCNEKEGKQKVLQLQRQHTDAIQNLHEQIRSLTKQLEILYVLLQWRKVSYCLPIGWRMIRKSALE
ncbi:unnamed protein product [Dracunculus medinensis]|uniref:PHD-type domain-containing protein n=1 Tax=Dracunculus medinensis TaxID=318479 RepID=A0A0N4UG58_DRAME|nr:unnamed protein product [Dracunculus medinensis]